MLLLICLSCLWLIDCLRYIVLYFDDVELDWGRWNDSLKTPQSLSVSVGNVETTVASSSAMSPSFSFVCLKCYKQRGVHITCIIAHSVTKGPIRYLDSGGRIFFVWVCTVVKHTWLKVTAPLCGKAGSSSAVLHTCCRVRDTYTRWNSHLYLRPLAWFAPYL